jgi:DNA-binding response OmpR family regulator
LRTARGLGIGGYLVKPVWPSALAERLAIVLGGRSGPGNQPA